MIVQVRRCGRALFVLLRLLADVLRLEARLAAALGEGPEGVVAAGGGRGGTGDVTVARALLDVLVEYGNDSGGGAGEGVAGAAAGVGTEASAPLGSGGGGAGAAAGAAGPGGALPEVALAALDCLTALIATRCAEPYLGPYLAPI